MKTEYDMTTEILQALDSLTKNVCEHIQENEPCAAEFASVLRILLKAKEKCSKQLAEFRT